MRSRSALIAILVVAAASIVAWTTCDGTRPTGDYDAAARAAAQTDGSSGPADARGPEPRPAAPRAARRQAPSVPSSSPGPGTSERPDARVAVNVRVLLPSGAAAAGATVRAESELGGGELGSPATVPADAPTGADGRAVLRLPHPLYTLHARLGEDVGEESLPLERPPGDVEIRLAPGTVVSGVVRSPDGVLIQGATVTVEGGGLLDHEMRATGEDGRFEAGPFRWTPERVHVQRHGRHDTTLCLRPGEPTRDLVLTIPAAVTLHGRCVDAAGAPIRRAAYFFQDGAYGDQQNGQTGDEGAFHAVMLPTAVGDAVFVLGGGWVAKRLTGALRTAGDVDLGDVVFERGANIRGRVVFEDGTPAGRGVVVVESTGLGGVATVAVRVGPDSTFDAGPFGRDEQHIHVRDMTLPGVLGEWEPVVVRGVLAGTDDVRVVLNEGPGVVVRLHAAGDAADAAPRAFGAVHVTSAVARDGEPRVERRLGAPNIHTVRLAAPPGALVTIELTAEGCDPWRAEDVRVPAKGTATLDAVLVPRPR